MSTHSFVNALFLTLVGFVIGAVAEKHTISFDNQCGHGTPQLIQKGIILSRGEPFTSSGPFYSGIAYLQTGNCLLNGESCTIVEMSLINPNPAAPGSGSSTDISLIPPLGFSVPVSFSYQGGCNGQGATCSSANCNTAFFVPDDNQVQVACQDNDVNLLITFCPGGSGGAPPAPAPSQPTSSSPIATPVKTPAHSPTPPAIVDTTFTTSSAAPASTAPQCPKGRSSRRRRALQARAAAKLAARHSRRHSGRALF